jgi:hypothetical protein
MSDEPTDNQEIEAAELAVRGLHACAWCRRPTAPADRSICETCWPAGVHGPLGLPADDDKPKNRLYVDQRPRVYARPDRGADGIIRVQFADITLALTLARASWLAADLGRVMRSVEMSDADRRRLKAGDRVLVTDDAGREGEYVVRCPPWQLGHGAWVVGLRGVSGGYALDRVVRLVEAAGPDVEAKS